jgi:hypothetical protein
MSGQNISGSAGKEGGMVGASGEAGLLSLFNYLANMYQAPTACSRGDEPP